MLSNDKQGVQNSFIHGENGCNQHGCSPPIEQYVRYVYRDLMNDPLLYSALLSRRHRLHLIRLLYGPVNSTFAAFSKHAGEHEGSECRLMICLF